MHEVYVNINKSYFLEKSEHAFVMFSDNSSL